MKPEPPPDLWDKMDAVHASRPNDEGFTMAEYSRQYKVPRRTAYDRIQNLLREGKLIQGQRHQNGRTLNVYRPK